VIGAAPTHAAAEHPHFTYYDHVTQLSFVWDGVSECIEVSEGGYQEPVTDVIRVSSVVPGTKMGALAWLQYFQAACRVYIIRREQK
jgi:hypothetical protein